MVLATILQKRHSLMRWFLFLSPTSRTESPTPDRSPEARCRDTPAPPRYGTADPPFRRRSRPSSHLSLQSPPRRLPRRPSSGYDRHHLPAVWRCRTHSRADASALGSSSPPSARCHPANPARPPESAPAHRISIALHPLSNRHSLLTKIGFRFGNRVSPEMENRRGQHRFGLALDESVIEVVQIPHAARRNHRNRHSL